MEATKEVLTRFPLDGLLFIITAGAFVVVAFPFSLPLSLATFHPFGNIMGLQEDFLTKTAETLLLSLIVGTIMYLNYGNYERLNHSPKWLKSRLLKKPDNPKTDFFHEKLENKYPQFNEWMRNKGSYKHIEFLNSMNEVSIGLLYGSETLVLMTIFLGFMSAFYIQWIGITSLLTVFFGVLYWTNNRRIRNYKNSYVIVFKEYEREKLK